MRPFAVHGLAVGPPRIPDRGSGSGTYLELRSADRHRTVPIPTLAAEPTEEALHAAGIENRRRLRTAWPRVSRRHPRDQGAATWSVLAVPLPQLPAGAGRAEY